MQRFLPEVQGASMNLYNFVGKRALDVGMAAVAGIVTAPLHALCALAIRLTSGSPVYFKQERVGQDGRTFGLVKFRTMKVGTHEASGGYPTAAAVTPVGRLLRKTSLDELPQLLNILRGDMSIVGPRPALPEQATRYSPKQRERLRVRPGLTGLAQIRYRNAAPWSVRIQSDLEYLERVTLWRDVKIICSTVPSVLTGGNVSTGQTLSEVDDLGPAGDVQ